MEWLTWCNAAGTRIGPISRDEAIEFANDMLARRAPSPDAGKAEPSAPTFEAIRAELSRARAKFPSNRHMLAALTEEVGELAQAMIDNHRQKASADAVRDEAIQVATMAIRVAEEGDADFSYACPVAAVAEEAGK